MYKRQRLGFAREKTVEDGYHVDREYARDENAAGRGQADVCLLYTSDAADDLLCVDLGGRRIIKKKKQTGATRCSNS